MPSGPGTYGRKRGRPRKRKGKKSRKKVYEMIGESIWDTYSDMAYILSEKKKAKKKDGSGWQGKV